jgi:hypothetical protein
MKINQSVMYLKSLAVVPFISVGFLCNHVYNIQHKQIYEVLLLYTSVNISNEQSCHILLLDYIASVYNKRHNLSHMKYFKYLALMPYIDSLSLGSRLSYLH